MQVSYYKSIEQRFSVLELENERLGNKTMKYVYRLCLFLVLFCSSFGFRLIVMRIAVRIAVKAMCAAMGVNNVYLFMGTEYPPTGTGDITVT